MIKPKNAKNDIVMELEDWPDILPPTRDQEDVLHQSLDGLLKDLSQGASQETHVTGRTLANPVTSDDESLPVTHTQTKVKGKLVYLSLTPEQETELAEWYGAHKELYYKRLQAYRQTDKKNKVYKGQAE